MTATLETSQPTRHNRLARLGEPMALYYWLLGATALLLGIGLATVLSASSYRSQRAYGTPYFFFERQLLFAVIGVAVMLLASRLPVRLWRAVAWLTYFGALGLLLLVLVVGVVVNGHRNWIAIGGPIRIQPSEFAKFALVVWGAHVLTSKANAPRTWTHLLVPLLPGGALLILLVAAEGDLGTAMVMTPILFALFFIAGAPMRLFVTMGAVALGGIAILSLRHGYRVGRFYAWLHPSSDPLGTGYQVMQGKAAMGSGGILGVGLGASRGKWGWLPEAHTDFIYAVVGEELGLIGTLLLLGAFVVIALCLLTLSRRTTSTFTRYAAFAILAWIFGQALVNIGAVLGLLPVTGIPLPLVSYGGSSLIPTLLAIGLALGLARQDARGATPDTDSVEPNQRRSRRVRAAA